MWMFGSKEAGSERGMSTHDEELDGCSLVAAETMYYAFFTVIEIACTALIVWYAWNWRNPEGSPVNIALAEGKSA
jgi:hypothetical protein